jgi:hypothetical protein
LVTLEISCEIPIYDVKEKSMMLHGIDGEEIYENLLRRIKVNDIQKSHNKQPFLLFFGKTSYLDVDPHYWG